MDLHLEGKVVFVTGGFKGIGKGIALQLAREGAIPVVLNRKDGVEDEFRAEISEITKTFESSDTQSIPESVAFYVYKKGTTEAAELEMRVVDANGTESWQKVARQPITLGGFTETERQSIVVRLDPGAYTVVESTDEHFPEKLQMPLSQAERRVLQISELYRAHNQEPQPVKVKIDYMKNGQTDRYFLPLQIGAGGSLLSQMREHISSYQANQEKISQLFHSVPDEYRKVLQKELTPFLHNSLDGLSKELLPYFQWHCGVGELGRQLEEQADMLPENERASFRSGVQEALDGLRQSINLGTIPEPPALYRERTAQQEADRTALLAKAPRQFRESAEVHLQQLQKSEDKASPLPQHEPGRPVKSKYHSWIRAQEARKRSVSEHRSRQSKPRKSPER